MHCLIFYILPEFNPNQYLIFLVFLFHPSHRLIIFLPLFLVRIFSHPNVLPVVGCCNSPPNLVVITQYLPLGSLFNMLHQESSIVVETAQVLKFALDIAKGMAFIHSLERLVPNLYLSSKHVMVSVAMLVMVMVVEVQGFFSFGLCWQQ